MRLGGEPVVESLDRAQADSGTAVRSEVAAVYQTVARRQRWQLAFKAMGVGDANDSNLVRVFGQAGRWRASVRRRAAVEQERGNSGAMSAQPRQQHFYHGLL